MCCCASPAAGGQELCGLLSLLCNRVLYPGSTPLHGAQCMQRLCVQLKLRCNRLIMPDAMGCCDRLMTGAKATAWLLQCAVALREGNSKMGCREVTMAHACWMCHVRMACATRAAWISCQSGGRTRSTPQQLQLRRFQQRRRLQHSVVVCSGDSLAACSEGYMAAAPECTTIRWPWLGCLPRM
jgi:hypothetical protein